MTKWLYRVYTKGTIKWSPIRKGNIVIIVVLWIVGGTKWHKYSGPTSLEVFCDAFAPIVFPNLSRHTNTVRFGKNMSNLSLFWLYLIGVFLIWQNSQFHKHTILHKHIQTVGECRLNIFQSWIYSSWILISVIYQNVWIHLL